MEPQSLHNAPAVALVEQMAQYFDPQMRMRLWLDLMQKSVPGVDDLMLLQHAIDATLSTCLLDTATSLASLMGELGSSQPDLAPIESRHRAAQTIVDTLMTETDPVLAFFVEENMSKLKPDNSSYNAVLVQGACDVSTATLDSILKLGKMLYSLGAYPGAIRVLGVYSFVCTDDSKRLDTMWGLLAASLMEYEAENSVESLGKVLSLIDNATFLTPAQRHMQWAWAMHWALLVYHQFSDCLEHVMGLFVMPQSLAVIQNTCPWLMRYLCAGAAVTRKHISEVAALCAHESYRSSGDPLCVFFERLYTGAAGSAGSSGASSQGSLEEAGAALREADAALSFDTFLAPYAPAVMSALRSLVLSRVTTAYTRLPLVSLRTFLGLQNVVEAPEAAAEPVPEAAEGDEATLDLSKEGDASSAAAAAAAAPVVGLTVTMVVDELAAHGIALVSGGGHRGSASAPSRVHEPASFENVVAILTAASDADGPSDAVANSVIAEIGAPVPARAQLHQHVASIATRTKTLATSFYKRATMA